MRLFISLIACLAFPGLAEVQTSTYNLHVVPIAPGANPYVYHPFEVPQGAREVVVQLDYDRAEYQNIVDFAIFDATFSGRDDDLTGYRGKNPNRAPLISIVGRDHASYGHIAGPMPAGTWRVMFYVYRALPAGVDLKLTITIASDATPLPPRQQNEWLVGDLHAHTLHSDGTWTVSTLAGAAQREGLDFIAVTDHNTAAHHAEIDAMPSGGPLLIKGLELTTAGGHANLWGVPKGTMVEFRQLPGEDAAIKSVVEKAHSMGALISINHPFAICQACGWAFDKSAPGFDSIEVWNGSWGPEDEQALKMWDDLLRSGRRITGLGASDTHGPGGLPGHPAVHVRAAALNERAILDAIRTGDVVLTASPGMLVTLRAGDGTQLQVEVSGFGAGMIVLHSAGGQLTRWPVRAGGQIERFQAAEPGYYRVEVRDASGAMLGFTNPVWVR